MKKIILALIASASFASAAQAGGLMEPVVEPVLAAAPIIIADEANWTGAYAGVSVGELEAIVPGAKDETIKAVQLGYMMDMGQYVIGAELGYSETKDLDLTSASAKLGYDAGNILPYVHAGIGEAKADSFTSQTTSFGLGIDYKLSESILIGAEWSKTDFDKSISGVSPEGDTLKVKMNYRF